MKQIKFLLVLFFSLILLCGCNHHNGTALKINETIITNAEFNKLFLKDKRDKIVKTSKNGGRLNISNSEMRQKFADELIKKTLLEQEYKKRNITASEADIEYKIEQTKKFFPSEEIFNATLQRQGISDTEFNEIMASSVKMDKLINKVINPKISDSEAEKYYKKNIQIFTTPQRVRFSHILIKTNYLVNRKNFIEKNKHSKLNPTEIDKIVKEETEKNKALLVEIQKTITPQNFAQLAKIHSQDPKTAKSGGDIGFVTRKDISKALGDEVFEQKVGTISPEIKSPQGSHIVYVLDKAASVVQPYETVKADIKVRIYTDKKAQYLTKLYEGLYANSKIVYGDKSLQKKKDNVFSKLFKK